MSVASVYLIDLPAMAVEECEVFAHVVQYVQKFNAGDGEIIFRKQIEVNPLFLCS